MLHQTAINAAHGKRDMVRIIQPRKPRKHVNSELSFSNVIKIETVSDVKTTAISRKGP